MPITSHGFKKTATPDLAKAIAAATLFVAVAGVIWLASRIPGDLALGTHRPAEQRREASFVDGERRMVRTTTRPGRMVVCSEGPRQLLQVPGAREAGLGASAHSAVASTLYLREAGWQICTAYANGAIDKVRYGDLLTRILNTPHEPLAAANGARAKRIRTRLPGRKHRHAAGRKRSVG